MVVVPRTSSVPDDGAQITSPNVATKTVVGMVLGILCLFAMVISYQLLSCPCKKRNAARRVPRNRRDPVITTLHTPSKTSRSFSNCFGLFKPKRQTASSHPCWKPTVQTEKLAESTGRTGNRRTLRTLYLSLTERKSPQSPHDTSTSETVHPPTLRERRALRSLYLNTSLTSPRKKYPDTPSSSPWTPTRKRMARLFQFDSTPPDTPSTAPFYSPRTPTGRRHYKQLDDSLYSEWANEEANRTKRPKDAVISPWSPDEGEFPPYSPYSPTFGSLGEPYTPPPLYPPPPAYLPEIPLRGPGSNPATPTRPRADQVPRSPLSRTPEPPPSPIVSSLREEIDGDIGSWGIQEQLRQTVTVNSSRDADVFVISNESEDGHDITDMETISIASSDSVDPFTLDA